MGKEKRKGKGGKEVIGWQDGGKELIDLRGSRRMKRNGGKYEDV